MSLRATRHSCHAICSMPPTRTFTSTCRLRPVFVLLSYFLDGPVDSPVLCVSEPRRRAITTLIRHINDPRNRRQKKTQLGEARSQERQKRFVAASESSKDFPQVGEILAWPDAGVLRPAMGHANHHVGDRVPRAGVEVARDPAADHVQVQQRGLGRARHGGGDVAGDRRRPAPARAARCAAGPCGQQAERRRRSWTGGSPPSADGQAPCGRHRRAAQPSA